MDPRRRVVLKGAASWAAFMLVMEAGPLSKAAFAAWPEAAFQTRDQQQAISLVDGGGMIEMRHVTITAPKLAENGAVVPVSVESDLPNVVSISIFAENNPFPLNSEYELAAGVLPFVSTRIRLSRTQEVMGVVKTADGRLYGGKALVKVTIGGCGG